MKIEILCIAIAILSAITAVCVILWYRKRTKRILNQVLNRINDAIAGKHQEAPCDEEIMSAIEERLNQFLSISKDTKEATLKEKDTVQALVSDISHQTKTPLANILLYSEILRERTDVTEEIADMAKQIEQQANKLDFQIKSLVRASYLESELISLDMRTESLDRLILLACQEAEMKALKKDIRLEYKECGMTCKFDLKWTLEALSNILDNGVKYSQEHSRIVIEVTKYEMFYRIDVKDSGMGIPLEEQGLIFQRFYRSPLVRKEKGLGIGLYLAREIMARQSGFIKVSSEPGKGSVFSVFLCC